MPNKKEECKGNISEFYCDVTLLMYFKIIVYFSNTLLVQFNGKPKRKL